MPSTFTYEPRGSLVQIISNSYNKSKSIYEEKIIDWRQRCKTGYSSYMEDCIYMQRTTIQQKLKPIGQDAGTKVSRVSLRCNWRTMSADRFTMLSGNRAVFDVFPLQIIHPLLQAPVA